jgi:glyoxylase-like metal-dependent hydrolase (beta-lactamase superfamily II)
MNIVNVGYSSTHYYVLEEGDVRFLIDVGVPGSFGQLQANLRRAGIDLASIRYLLVTHYHPDHAGVVEEVKAAGPRLVVMEPQIEAIDYMRRAYIKPDSPYIPIRHETNRVLPLAESRAFLQQLGIHGEIIATPGHSDDSVSLVLDDGNAFVGDLTLPSMIGDDDADVVAASWQALADHKAKHIYSGHRPLTTIDDAMG